ncbi:hypothetical protein HK105_202639 [Polyrhizophydium stewartii]|uniref:Uncharacterized protein n=1 Tax=Polyrhizophydium stewartii TaxID=2732419 RepID=A0ABR4NE38_9FUNG
MLDAAHESPLLDGAAAAHAAAHAAAVHAYAPMLALACAGAASPGAFLRWGLSSAGRSTLRAVLDGSAGVPEAVRIELTDAVDAAATAVAVDAALRGDAPLVRFLAALHADGLVALDAAIARRAAATARHHDCVAALDAAA